MTEFFVPGRLCLFGEHTDWAGEYRKTDSTVPEGLCIIAGTDQGIRVRVNRHDQGFSIRQAGPEPGSEISETFTTTAEARQAAEKAGGFNAYAAGTAALIMERYSVSGLHMHVWKRDLPLRKGLSSSAAVCVATAKAFNQVFDLGLTVRDEMELAYRGELLTGSHCGRMDQACAMGSIPVLLTFNGDRMELETIELTGKLYILIVDLMKGKNTRRILNDLNSSFIAGNRDIREALGYENHRIINRALECMRTGRVDELGSLMNHSQHVFDTLVAPCCPEELEAPELHRILRTAEETGLALGGKGVGSQGDGTAQILCRGLEEREELKNILENSSGVKCCSLTI